MSVQEFLNSMFGKLPELFKNEDELRRIWSNPLTRKTLLEKLEEAGLGKDEFTTMQKIIDAENSDLFDVLEFISFSVTPITREQRVASAQEDIFSPLDAKQKEFIEFVLSKYIETGVEELEQEKLAILIQNKYQSLEDGRAELGDLQRVREIFIEFQKYLYQKKVA